MAFDSLRIFGMAGQKSIVFDSAQAHKTLALAMKKAGITVEEGTRQHARMLCVACATNATGPLTYGGKSDQKVGILGVQADIAETFISLSDNAIARYTEGGAKAVMRKKSGGKRNRTIVPEGAQIFRTADAALAHIRKTRFPGGGKERKVTPLKRAIILHSAREKLEKTLTGLVGYTASAWARAAELCGSKAGNMTRGIPAWAKKWRKAHAPKVDFRFDENFDFRSGKGRALGYFECWSGVNHMSNAFNFALFSAQEKIVLNKYIKYVQKRLKEELAKNG